MAPSQPCPQGNPHISLTVFDMPSMRCRTDTPPLDVLDLRTLPYRIEDVSQFDLSFAESQLKYEADALHHAHPFLRRVKSRLTRPDAAFTATALLRNVESNGSAVVTQIYIDKLRDAGVASSEKFEAPGNLLIMAVRNSNLDAVKVLASWSSVNSLSLALNIAVLIQSAVLVKVLVETGADTDHLPRSTLAFAASSDLPIFQLILQAPKQLPYQKFGCLCHEAIKIGNLNALRLLLRRLPDYTILCDPTSAWSRDKLLQTAISSSHVDAFLAIVAATRCWGLTDAHLFFAVLDSALQPNVRDMIDALLDLYHPAAETTGMDHQLETLLLHCVENGLTGLLRSMTIRGIAITARVISRACETRHRQIVEILLQGHVQGDETLLATIAAAFEDLREPALLQLLRTGNRGPWVQRELLRSASLAQSHLVAPLTQAGASVDCGDGECLKLAVSAGHVPMVKTLLSQHISLQTLQSAFPIITRAPPLSRRLMTKMFIQKGVSGSCVTAALNDALCNYSATRDPDLLEVLSHTDAICNIRSLLVCMQNNDSQVFDQLRSSTTLRYHGLREWFASHHELMFNHVSGNTTAASISSSILRLSLHVCDHAHVVCDAHNGPRKLECFHRFLESGAIDRPLLDQALVTLSKADPITLTEIALTASCFCDPDTVVRILRSEPFATSHAGSSDVLTIGPQGLIVKLDSIMVPPPSKDMSPQSDHNSAITMQAFFHVFLRGTSNTSLTTKLLRRHLKGIARSMPSDTCWPLLTVDFFLCLALDKGSVEFEACLQMCISYQQWEIFRKLLNGQLPADTMTRLLTSHFPLLSLAGMEIFLESVAMAHMTADCMTVLQSRFEAACESRDHKLALLLASKSPCQLQITNILKVFHAAKHENDTAEHYYNILSFVAATPADLEALWDFDLPDLLLESTAPLIKALLSAGATGPHVAETLMTVVEIGEHQLLSVFLSYWKTDRCLRGRQSSEFTTPERRQLSASKSAATDPAAKHAFFEVLGRALLLAVHNRDLKMCLTLLAASAPLIAEGRCILSEAMVHMDFDMLSTFMTACIPLEDFGSAGIDFALLQAVFQEGPEIVQLMLDLGGSAQAYDSQALNAATLIACQRSVLVLAKILSNNPEEAMLVSVAEQVTNYLKTQCMPLDRFCELFELLHENGLKGSSYYNQAFCVLCGTKSTTWAQAQSLIALGADVHWADGACMNRARSSGNLQLFPQLFSQCHDQLVSNAIFRATIEDFISAESPPCQQSCEDALVVLAPLLATRLPQRDRFTALKALTCQPEPHSAIIELMLQTGAEFPEHGGETLYRICCLNDSNLNALIEAACPPIVARQYALTMLFRSQGSKSTGRDGECCLDLEQACLKALLWPEEIPNNLLNNEAAEGLFNAILSPTQTVASSAVVLSFLSTTQGLAFVSGYCAAIGGAAMEQLVAVAVETSNSASQDRHVAKVMNALQIEAPRTLAGLELQSVDSDNFYDCLANQEDSSEVQVSFPAMYLPAVSNDLKSEFFYSDDFELSYSFPVAGTVGKGYKNEGLAVGRISMNKLLFCTMKRERSSILASTFIHAGASSNATNSEGNTVLYLATSRGDLETVRELIGQGAGVDDGSLHLAACKDHHEIIALLIKSGHSLDYRSPLYEQGTVIEAFLRFRHSEQTADKFEETMQVILQGCEHSSQSWLAQSNLVELALQSQHAFQMSSALFSHRPRSQFTASLLRRGPYLYSALSAVEKWETGIQLTSDQRRLLAAQLENLGIKRVYYAAEGTQPKGAIGIPDCLLDENGRDRLRAWTDKDCSVCGDRPEDSADVHARMTPACAEKHGWPDQIICVDCLKQCLESKMFPSGDERFPSAQVTCWAPSCGAVLDHPTIQLHADEKRFRIYDDALCQQHLHAGKSIAKCARDLCRGAIWLDPIGDKDVTIFSCPNCNQPYKKHANEPCPAGEAAKADARKREEEKLSAAVMEKEKKCPKCKLPYHRTEGCDHIVCGKDAHSAAKTLGCGFEFCYLCERDYNEIRRKGNKAHAKTCPHYA